MGDLWCKTWPCSRFSFHCQLSFHWRSVPRLTYGAGTLAATVPRDRVSPPQEQNKLRRKNTLVYAGAKAKIVGKLGPFASLYRPCVCLSACDNSRTAQQIFVKFRQGVLLIFVGTFKFWLKSDKNN
jgi:hypothetical protein